jgi:NADH:ubiquinone oxidoreductase subunit 4 (subunit M)
MLFFYPVVAAMTICGVIFCSMSAIVQLDLKKLIAYSSVAHMNLVLLGIFSLNLQGIQGSLFLMLAHGLVSSGLFFLVGFLYDRHHTRVITYYSGLAQTMPVFSTVLFLFFLANISFPLTANFVGEVLILVGVVQKSFFSAFLVATGTILSAIYSFFSYARLAFLGVSPYIETYTEITSIEFQTVCYFFFLILVLGIKPDLVLEATDFAVSQLLIDVSNSMLLSIIITPLIVFLALAFFGRFVGHNGTAIISPFFMLSNAIFSFVAFYYVGILENFTYICLGT